jgi:WD40 repeat protein
MIAIGFKDGKINIWRTADTSLLSSITAHADAVSELQFTSNSQTLLSMGGEDELCLWSVPEGKNLKKIKGVGWYGSLGWNDRIFAAETPKKRVDLWDLQADGIVKRLAYKGVAEIDSISFTPGYKYLISAYLSGVMAETENGEQCLVMQVNPDPPKIERLQGNQVSISVGDLSDQTAPIRGMIAGRATQSVAIYRGWAGKPDIVEIWNVETKSKTATLKLKGNGGPMNFSFDDSMLAVGNKEEITIWDLKKRKLVAQREGGGVFEFSPVSPELAVAGSDELLVYRLE